MTTKLAVLYALEQVAVIVKMPSGVRYLNQVAGVNCSQEEEEGILCPIYFDPDAFARLSALDYPLIDGGMTEELVARIDAILKERESTAIYQVDRAEMHRSFEAWVHVTIQSTDGATRQQCPDYRGVLYGFGTAAKGVLTWSNSD